MTIQNWLSQKIHPLKAIKTKAYTYIIHIYMSIDI